MRKSFLTYVVVFLSVSSFMTIKAQDAEQRRVVSIETTKGNITIELYNETPLHRDNFLKLVDSNYYEGIMFHRVIKDFMIQAGESKEITSDGKTNYVDKKENEKISAEIRYPQLFHKKGVIAAAREGDDVNPERASSASQFYIVVGQRFNDPMLERVQQTLDKRTNGQIVLTDDIKEIYKTLGGTPHLDGQYTVFGEVIDGMDVVELIEKVATDSEDRPLEDIEIKKVTLLK